MFCPVCDRSCGFFAFIDIHSIVNNDIYCGGSNHCGQIGIGEVEDEYRETEDFDDLFAYIEPFTKIEVPEKKPDDAWMSIACGPRGTATVSDSGLLFMWGTLTPSHIYSKPTMYVVIMRLVS